MGISLANMYEDVRDEGLGIGIPMTFLKLGSPGVEYETSAKLLEYVFMRLKSKWVCVLGEATTQAGMGAFAKGMHQLQITTEFECSGKEISPNWLHSVDRWVVDYTGDDQFNFTALRTPDTVRFYLGVFEDLKFISKGLSVLDTPKKLFAGTKYIVVNRERYKQFREEILSLAKSSPRTRVFVKE